MRLEPGGIVLSIEQDIANSLHQQILGGVDVQRILDDVEPLGSESIEDEWIAKLPVLGIPPRVLSVDGCQFDLAEVRGILAASTHNDVSCL